MTAQANAADPAIVIFRTEDSGSGVRRHRDAPSRGYRSGEGKRQALWQGRP